MHVFCPDCNAEYKVNERSSLTKTVKFVCIECGSSWVDKFEKLEQTKRIATDSMVSKSDGVIEDTNTEVGKMELNTLALEEVQNSFGNLTNRIDSKNDTETDHIFQFETSEESNEIGEEGPSKTFPKIRSNQESPSPTNEEIEERDIKEIEIERRLKESSELLKKAKQPNLENKETKLKESKLRVLRLITCGVFQKARFPADKLMRSKTKTKRGNRIASRPPNSFPVRTRPRNQQDRARARVFATNS